MTLTTRLTLILVLVFVGLCAALVHQSMRTAERYFQSVTQELSAPIAMYIAQNQPPFRAGTFDPGAFRELADKAMILNPSIEVYALDRSGRVLGSAGAHPLERQHVELAPLRQFIAGTRTGPVTGDDPRDAGGRRIFSAAAVGPPESPWGFVYVILDSSARQVTTARALPEQVAMLTGGGILLTLLAGLMVAALLFGRITLPLRSLAREVSEFEAQIQVGRGEAGPGERDEIRQLATGFASLRSRIAAQMEALQAADRSRREWIAHLSHDLRTPLTTLQAHIEMVLRRDGSASASERREGLARALLHCQQVQHLLTELFESARLEAPSLELRNECFALGELAQDAAVGLSDAAERLGIRLECAIETCDTTIKADIGLFHRLIDNLLTNAVKAARRGTTVVLGVGRVNDTVILTLTDTGDGPTASMLRVFNDGQEPPVGAAGFGLRIIGQILRLHGLTSRASAGPAGGTIIRIEIPAVLEGGAMQPVLRR